MRRSTLERLREWGVVGVAGLLALLAIGAVIYLTRQADRHRQAQVRLGQVTASVDALPTVPLTALYTGRGQALALLQLLQGAIGRQLTTLGEIAPNPELAGIKDAASRFAGDISSTLTEFSSAELSPAGRARPQLAGLLSRFTAEYYTVSGRIADASKVYSRQADRALLESYVGSALAILLAFTGFASMLRRVSRAHGLAKRSAATAEALAAENASLLETSREEAQSDALTGLGNRRKLIADLTASLVEPTPHGWLLAIYDLDGFKLYNDRFGHPAGDALLTRLGRQLRDAVAANGSAYRMGGDEFCVLARLSAGDDADEIAAAAAEALSLHGDGFTVGSSHGAATLPLEAQSVEAALHLADGRLYAKKTRSRGRAPAQTRDALWQVLVERSPDLGGHHVRVAHLAKATAVELGLGPVAVERTRIAAELHDLGKVAIPEAVLQKPGPLDELEWELVRAHTRVGERIVAAAPALAEVAHIVRATHEGFDGTGYPDRKAGEDIPIEARIISVCDAYDAMTNDRPYRAARSREEALAEIRRCAGAHFDPEVVTAFLAVEASSQAAAAA